jgi:uncharacterized protein YjbI with pentapeptide repeats
MGMGIITNKLNILKVQSKLVASVAFGVIIGGAGTGVVLASTSAVRTDGTVHACYVKDGTNAGSVRVLANTDDSCSDDESAISWNSATPGQYVTDLATADFSGADLRYRNFRNMNLHGANFQKTSIVGAVFDGANLSDSTFDQTAQAPDGRTLSTSGSFKGADLSNSKFINSIDVGNSDFSNANFDGVLFDTFTAFDNDNFTNVDFRTITLGSSGTYNVPRIISSNLNGANFSGLDLSYVTFQGNSTISTDFTGTNFTNAFLYATDMQQANLTNAIWSNTQCPDNTNSDNNGGTCIDHLDPSNPVF